MNRVVISFWVMICALGIPLEADAAKNALEVRTESPGVKVFFDGVFKGETEFQLVFNMIVIEDITPGPHTLKCELEGFEPYTTTVNVPADKAIVHEVSFTATSIKVEQIGEEGGQIVKAKGVIVVKSKPTRAIAQIDNSKQGKTDLVFRDVPVGKHKLEVFFDKTKPGQYLTTSLSVGDGSEITVFADFLNSTITVDAQYYLSVVSDPPGEVFIDGKKVGPCPVVDLELDSGRYEIEIRKAGYTSYKETIQLDSDTLIQSTLEKAPKYGFLDVLQDQLKGKEYVRVDGTGLGYTPISSTQIQAGLRSVRIGMTTNSYTIEEGKGYRITPLNFLEEKSLLSSAKNLNGYVAPPRRPSLLPKYENVQVAKHKGWSKKKGKKGLLYGCVIGAGLFAIGASMVEEDPGYDWDADVYVSANNDDAGAVMSIGYLSPLIFGFIFAITGEDYFVTERIKQEENIALNDQTMAAWRAEVKRVENANELLLQEVNEQILFENLGIKKENKKRGYWEFEELY